MGVLCFSSFVFRLFFFFFRWFFLALIEFDGEYVYSFVSRIVFVLRPAIYVIWQRVQWLCSSEMLEMKFLVCDFVDSFISFCLHRNDFLIDHSISVFEFFVRLLGEKLKNGGIYVIGLCFFFSKRPGEYEFRNFKWFSVFRHIDYACREPMMFMCQWTSDSFFFFSQYYVAIRKITRTKKMGRERDRENVVRCKTNEIKTNKKCVCIFFVEFRESAVCVSCMACNPC